MKKITLTLFALIGAFVWLQAKPFPKRTKRVLFLGNSITYAGTYVSAIEAYLITHFPKQSYEFINVGLPSETVSGLSEPNHADGRFPRPICTNGSAASWPARNPMWCLPATA